MSQYTLLFTQFLVLLAVIRAQGDNSDTRHEVIIKKHCKPPSTHEERCGRSSCLLRYRMRRKWRTELDAKATPLLCEQQCQIHQQKCIWKCGCTVRTREVSSTVFCKCVLAVPGPPFPPPNTCLSACNSAFLACRSGCLSGTCVRAATDVIWERDFNGECVRKTYTTGGSGGSPL